MPASTAASFEPAARACCRCRCRIGRCSPASRRIEETLVEQVEGVRLLVLGRRGESADTTQRDLGRKVERVVRALNRPILTVTEDFHEPQRVMIAFDGGTVTRRGVEMVAGSPLFRGLPITLLMAGKESQDAPKQLDWAKTTLRPPALKSRHYWHLVTRKQ